MILHYDYNHLADSGKTNLYVPTDEELSLGRKS